MRIYIKDVNTKRINELKQIVKLKISKPLRALITDTSKIETVMLSKDSVNWFLIKKANPNVSNRQRDGKGKFI